MPMTNRRSEKAWRESLSAQALSLALTWGCLWLVAAPAAAERDELTIGITQFPSTLNPNIDAMAAKSYVLGAALRPFTVYDADWKLVCLLCVKVPSIEEGDAVAVDMPDGRKGIDITFTIRPDASW